MTAEIDRDLSDEVMETRRQIREKATDGTAYSWGYDQNPMYAMWDEATEQWLVAVHHEGSYRLYPRDTLPVGYSIGEGWGDAEYVSVEGTPLYHNTYGLDRAREGYGEHMID